MNQPLFIQTPDGRLLNLSRMIYAEPYDDKTVAYFGSDSFVINQKYDDFLRRVADALEPAAHGNFEWRGSE